MKKIFNIAIVIVIVVASITSCDIIEEPFLVPVAGSNDTIPIVEKVRKVLLEDFTGQKCPNCPEAAEIAHNLKTIYGEQLILLTVHAGYYATPDATGDFTADFRTPEGTELNDYFDISLYGYPMGMVNRTEYNGMPIVIKDDWQSAVSIQVEMEVEAAITMTNTYTAGTRKLDCLLETEFLETLDGTYNICAFIAESGILSPQQTEQNVNLTYEHNHVLRASMNGTWGEVVGEDGQAVSEVKLTNSYSYILPAGWNADNCAVIAFVYNTATNEVVQAEEKKLDLAGL